MSARNPRAVRAFIVGLVIALGWPPLLLWSAGVMNAELHVDPIRVVLPLAGGAYPFSAVTNFPPWLAGSLTLVQMAGLCLLFARFTRSFNLAEQIVAALLLLIAVTLVGDIAYALLGLEVTDASFPWY